MKIDLNTPVAMLTVGQLKEALREETPLTREIVNTDRNFVYGIAGIARLFNCSSATANRIKKSGKIDKAIKQIGKKIIVDAELALQLAGEKQGGRKKGQGL
jgi:hypothetical protein